MSKEFLKIHFDGKHYDERIKARDGIFECNICNRELKSYGHAERHMKLFHPSEESNCLNLEDTEFEVPNYFQFQSNSYRIFNHFLNYF